ncbi:MAG: NAD(P)-dependent oxidoreductase [Methylovulum sp.]|nr:NAD(P)-dependent oxidoreductase [Methylovulum sp.]
MNTKSELPHLKKCVIFGGTGFIGSHFAEYLVRNELVDEVYLADIQPIRPLFSFDKNRIHYVELDVRKPIDPQVLPSDVALVANFAAVHREPGHEDYEYYETNLYGAENVCAWAESIDCKHIIFTSSISSYGPSETSKDETTLPVPVSAYGGSKLAAEKIHLCWQNGDSANRHLVIVRPGVVFGPGEGGNVSRLVKAVLHRYFFYMGNRETRKAGSYVKELCHALWWVLQRQNETGERVSLFNMTMNPGPTIQDYVNTVCKVAGVKRWVPSVPYRLLWLIAHSIDLFANPLGIKHPFSPVRIKKLVRSNNILPNYLVNNGYLYQYDLEAAFRDWQESCPEEWL